jgi:hypothetical protein
LGSAALHIAIPQDLATRAVCDLRPAQGDPAARGAPDGRAIRILIASLLT